MEKALIYKGVLKGFNTGGVHFQQVYRAELFNKVWRYMVIFGASLTGYWQWEGVDGK